MDFIQSVLHHVTKEINANRIGTGWNIQKKPKTKPLPTGSLKVPKYKEGNAVAESKNEFKDMVNHLTTMKL